MAEPPAWRYQKIIKPMFDQQPEHTLLRGRVLTCAGDEVIEDGFVELEGGKITAVGAAAWWTKTLWLWRCKVAKLPALAWTSSATSRCHTTTPSFLWLFRLCS